MPVENDGKCYIKIQKNTRYALTMSVNVYNLIVVGCILQKILACEWNKPYAEAIDLKPARHGSQSQLHNYSF